MSSRALTSIAAVLVLAVGASGCAAGQASEGTKAGSGSPTITLTLGTDDTPGRPGAEQIEVFAREVAQRSDGELLVEPAWQASEQDQDDWDQDVARQVMAGDLDMGMIPSRAWDTEGVTTLRALNAPFLITSEAAAAAVATSDLAEPLMAGLEDVGVTGLALLPEGLRRLFAYREPILTVDDLDGALVRVPASATTYALFEAWGATPDDVSASDDTLAAGAESSFFHASNLSSPSTTAGNQVLYPKVNVLVINSDTLDQLSSEHQQTLRAAAVAARDWSVENPPDEAALAGDFCAAGGQVITLSAQELAGFEQGAAQVTEDLRADEETATLLDAIATITDEVGAEPTTVPDCTRDDAADADAAGPTEPDTAGVFPQGSFRADRPAADFVAAGVNEQDTFNHAGVWTMTFDRGRVVISDVNAGTGKTTTDEQPYCVDGDRVAIGFTECGDFWTARWVQDGDTIRFLDLTVAGAIAGDEALVATIFGSTPWTRVR